MKTRKNIKVHRKTQKTRTKYKPEKFHFSSVNCLKKSALKNGGYGIFAGKDFVVGEIVEVCPFIEIPRIFLSHPENPLRHYVFTSHLTDGYEICVFGNGSLFNHSKNNNVYYYHDCTGNRLLYYAALQPIKKGEEMFINYGNKHSVSSKKKNLITAGSEL